MNTRHIKIIFSKDWKELLKSKRALIPMITIPLFFVVIIPSILLIASVKVEANVLMSGDMDNFLERFPEKLMPEGMNIEQKSIYAMFVFFFAPFFLLIPILFSIIIAANSFAGEKERKTIEGLLYTPVSNKDLLLGKILTAWIPSMLIAFGSFVIYAIIINSLAYPIMKTVFFPTLSWIFMMAGLVPAVSFLALALVVMISQRAAGVWEAEQLGGFLVLPIVALIISQASGLFYFHGIVIGVAAVIVGATDYLIYRYILQTFDRERMVTKLT